MAMVAPGVLERHARVSPVVAVRLVIEAGEVLAAEINPVVRNPLLAYHRVGEEP